MTTEWISDDAMDSMMGVICDLRPELKENITGTEFSLSRKLSKKVKNKNVIKLPVFVDDNHWLAVTVDVERVRGAYLVGSRGYSEPPQTPFRDSEPLFTFSPRDQIEPLGRCRPMRLR